MGIGIVEVLNNTGSVLHYVNTQTGYKFDVNPTLPTKGGNGGANTISASRFYDDTVPFKSSNQSINVSVDDGGPTFSVTDDDWQFSVICNTKAQEWITKYGNGNQFVMRVDPHGMSLVKFEEGLRSSDCWYVTNGQNLAVTEDYPNAYYAMKLK